MTKKIRKPFDSAVTTVENRFHDVVLTAMDNVVIPRNENTVRSITGLSERGPCSVAQNPDQREFPGNIEDTRLLLACSRIDLNVEQDRNDETRKVENFESSYFPALRPKYDQ